MDAVIVKFPSPVGQGKRQQDQPGTMQPEVRLQVMARWPAHQVPAHLRALVGVLADEVGRR